MSLKESVYEKMKDMGDYKRNKIIFEDEIDLESTKQHTVMIELPGKEIRIYNGFELKITGYIQVKSITVREEMIEVIKNFK